MPETEQGTPSSPSRPKLRLSKPHSLIQRMMAPPPKPDAYGYVRRDDWPGVDVRVSKPQRRIALIVMDRLFKAIEERGWHVDVSSYDRRGTFAVNGKDRTQIWIEERQRQVPHEPTPREVAEHERYRTRIPKWDTVYAGELVLHPGGPVDVTSESSIGLLINKAASDLEVAIAKARESREADERRRHEEYRRQLAAQQEKSRVDALHKAADSLREYRAMMEYIAEVRRFGRVPDDQRKEGQSLEEWLQWAEWRARCIHPLG